MNHYFERLAVEDWLVHNRLRLHSRAEMHSHRLRLAANLPRNQVHVSLRRNIGETYLGHDIGARHFDCDASLHRVDLCVSHHDIYFGFP